MSPTIVIAAVIAVLGAATYLLSYNRFVTQKNLVAESWKQVDVELQRRFDLIPNLVETVKGYAAHELDTLSKVVAARNAAQANAQSAPAERQATENQLTRALGGLNVMVEAYPDLKASANFLQVQRELTDTEDRIAAGRRSYNGNVRAYNTRIQSVPSNMVAKFGHFTPADYFELDDPAARAAVHVQF